LGRRTRRAAGHGGPQDTAGRRTRRAAGHGGRRSYGRLALRRVTVGRYTPSAVEVWPALPQLMCFRCDLVKSRRRAIQCES
jgi:hypothetical protein